MNGNRVGRMGDGKCLSCDPRQAVSLMDECLTLEETSFRFLDRLVRAITACTVRCNLLPPLLLIGAFLPLAIAAEQAPNAEQAAFFEAKIRPVLADQCYKCHSATAKDNKKLKGGLFLDSRSGVLTGGDTGPRRSSRENPIKACC